MNLLESKGGNLVKKCLVCGNEILKHGRNTCEICRDIQDSNNTYKPIAKYHTNALPGSLKKILILSWRHFNGYSIWHPKDITYEDLTTGRWLEYTPEQEEFEQQALIEIREILKRLDEKKQEIYNRKKELIKERLRKLKAKKEYTNA